jgi:hypothetical protein
MIELRSMRWVGKVARIGKNRNWESQMEDQDVDGYIILKWILEI